MNESLKIFSTCPPILGSEPRTETLQQIRNAARWSEDSGCEGILVYTDNRLLDPWLTSQVIIDETESLSPLVAIQPIYMHPYTAAKMISSLGLLTGRKLYLNMLAGGFKNDLIALNDNTPHDRRYDRTVEYTKIIVELLKGESGVSFEGDFYRTENLRLSPALPRELMPGVLLSGSSDAGLAASRVLGATAVQYPQPPSEYKHRVDDGDIDYGIRVGIIARSDSTEAWEIAEVRFPEDRKGQIAHALSMKVSDSSWHKQLSELGQHAFDNRNPYWLRPFENYSTFCPYLVGSYEDVADVVADYIDLGYTNFIVDIPRSPDDFDHISKVFELAQSRSRSV